MNNELDIYTATLDEIVFEDRNKSYGGYYLRVWYDKNVTRATILACSLFLLVSSGIYAYYRITDVPKEVFVPVKIEMEVVEDPIKEEEIKKLPPPPKLEQPKIETVKFLPPIIKPDNKVVKEVQLKDVDSLKNTNISTKDQEGDKNLKLQDFSEGDENGVTGGTGTKQAEIFTWAAEMPKFKNTVTEEESDKQFMSYIQNNINYPADAKAKNITGTVFVSFVITSTGEVANVEVIQGKGLSPSIDAEAVRVVKKMPKWTPAKNNGTIVQVKKVARIKFKLD